MSGVSVLYKFCVSHLAKIYPDLAAKWTTLFDEFKCFE